MSSGDAAMITLLQEIKNILRDIRKELENR